MSRRTPSPSSTAPRSPRAELDQLIERAKKAYTAQKQEFPKAGTPEYQNVQTQYVAFLVQREQFEKEAEKLGIEVTEKDVDKDVQEFMKSRFDGDSKEFEKALEEQGFTRSEFRGDDPRLGPRTEALRRGDEGRQGRRCRDPRVLHAELRPSTRRQSHATSGTS